MVIQSDLDYPDLDYPDFSIMRTFSLVPVWSWIFISHEQDPQPYPFENYSIEKCSPMRWQETESPRKKG